jgi:hypothetical protein
LFPTRRFFRLSALIVLAAVLLKIVLMWHVGGGIYKDPNRALNFGHLVDIGVFHLGRDVTNSKTYIGPIIWFAIFKAGGIGLLKLANLLLFAGLCVVQLGLGRPYGERTRLIALFLLAFYVGTNRNIVVGEIDDTMSALLFSAGVWAYLDSRRAFGAGVLMGLAFLFKFSAAIFIAAFGGYLILAWRLRDAVGAGVGIALPFLAITATTGGAGRALEISLTQQRGYSTWRQVAEKLVTTGMLVSVASSAVAWVRRRDERNTLFLVLSASYFVYVLANRDAFAASFVMMQCLVFSSFLIALFLEDFISARFMAAVLAGYLIVTTALTYRNLASDAKPVMIYRDEPNVERMFPWNFPGWPGNRRHRR